MDIGILTIEKNDYIGGDGFDIGVISDMLWDKGYDVRQTVAIDARSDISKTVEFLKASVQSIIVCGNVSAFCEAFSEFYTLNPEQKIVELENVIYAFMPSFSKEFLCDKVIPALNSKAKTFYNTVVFKTFGKTEAELREMLKEYIRNKN